MLKQHCQENRQTRIDTPLGDCVLALQHFSGSEALSQDFHYEMTVLSEDPSIDGNALIGKRISVTYSDEDGRQRFFNGFVSRFEYNRQVEEPVKATSYTLEMVPWLWFLRHNSDCQIFQAMTTPEIVRNVFEKLGFTDYRLQLSDSYSPREYCVQYRESNFDFVSRLMEEEGIFYYFEHTAATHTLVLCDSTSNYYDIDESDVRYGGVSQSQEKQLTSWRHVYEFRPGRIAQKDYNFKKPTDGLVTDQSSSVKFEGSSKLEVYEYPGLYDEADKGDRLSKVRMEELEAEHDHVVGGGSYLNFSPGGKFEVQQHSRPGEQGRSYAIVEVHTEFNSNLGFDRGEEEDFQNEFKCIPSDTAFRPPRRTIKPVVEGPQTAIVVTDGQEIVVDEHARVKVQFHWDRYGQKDINSSCWIRVSQVHAGNGWGMIDIPRKDEEVIVSFLEGDPDRPIVTGRVYNGDNPAPYGLKGAGDNTKNKTRRGNTTKSYESGGYNEMTMDDTAGQEQIRIHGQNDMNTTVQNDETLTVNNNRDKKIAVDETNSIGSNRKTKVGINDDESIGNNQTIDVGSDQDVSIGSKQNINIGKMKNEVVGMMSNEAVGLAKTTNVGGAYSIIAGTMNTAVATWAAEEVTLDKKVIIGSDYSVSAGDGLRASAGDIIEIKCGASSITLEKGGKVTIKGTSFLFESSGDVKINGSIIDLN